MTCCAASMRASPSMIASRRRKRSSWSSGMPILLAHQRDLAGPWALRGGLLLVGVLTRPGGARGSLGSLGQPGEVIHAHPKDTRNRGNRPDARLLAFPFANPLHRLHR